MKNRLKVARAEMDITQGELAEKQAKLNEWAAANGIQ